MPPATMRSLFHMGPHLTDTPLRAVTHASPAASRLKTRGVISPIVAIDYASGYDTQPLSHRASFNAYATLAIATS